MSKKYIIISKEQKLHFHHSHIETLSTIHQRSIPWYPQSKLVLVKDVYRALLKSKILSMTNWFNYIIIVLTFWYIPCPAAKIGWDEDNIIIVAMCIPSIIINVICKIINDIDICATLPWIEWRCVKLITKEPCQNKWIKVLAILLQFLCQSKCMIVSWLIYSNKWDQLRSSQQNFVRSILVSIQIEHTLIIFCVGKLHRWWIWLLWAEIISTPSHWNSQFSCINCKICIKACNILKILCPCWRGQIIIESSQFPGIPAC